MVRSKHTIATKRKLVQKIEKYVTDNSCTIAIACETYGIYQCSFYNYRRDIRNNTEEESAEEKGQDVQISGPFSVEVAHNPPKDAPIDKGISNGKVCVMIGTITDIANLLTKMGYNL